MRVTRVLHRQFMDLLCYQLIPLLAVVTPGAFSLWLIRRVTHWEWLLGEEARLAMEGAGRHLQISDGHAWRTRWKRVQMLDVRDICMMSFGRWRTVLAEVECDVDFEIARDRVMVGMHWGPGASILRLFAEHGLTPALPYRPPEKQLRWRRPFFYVFSWLSARYMRRTLGDRAVPVGGAGRVLRDMFEVKGCIIVVSDAPPMAGRPTISREVLGRNARFDAGFPGLMAKNHRKFVLYAINLAKDGSMRKKLELYGPYEADSAEDYLNIYSDFLDRHLLDDAPQWRIWHVENQFWG